MREITDNDFEIATTVDGKVLVDFYSTFCAPCKALDPLLEGLEQATSDVTFVKINIDEQATQASLYGVIQVPTLLLFEDGYEIKRHVGLMPAPALRAWLGV